MGKKEPKTINPPPEISLNLSNSFLFAFILGCFFISCFTGLTYEVLWTRMIVKIIGGAPFAVSIVLTVFMGGLGLGSYIAARTIDRIKDPMQLIKLYGVLELVIGIYCFFFPTLLGALKPLFVIFYNYFFNSLILYNLTTFIGCTFLLSLPVTCMGATLPILCRYFVTNISEVGTHAGRLYGLNTIGAAAGAFICGFWLINNWGVQASLGLAIGLNVAIGSVCVMLSCKIKTGPTLPRDAPFPDLNDHNAGKVRTTRINSIFALILFAVSGFCAMSYQVVWTKLLGLIVGPTTYSFTVVLVVFILGLSLGSLFFGQLTDKLKNPMLLLLITQVGAALTAILMSQIIGNSQIFFAKLIFQFKDNFALLVMMKSLVLFGFLFWPTFFLGASFPIVGVIITDSLSRIGRLLGSAYMINTVGAVLGSFCVGFLLIPLLGKEQSLKLIVTVQVLTVLLISTHVFWQSKQKILAWIPLWLAVILGFVSIAYFPNWDHKMLSKGKYYHFSNPESLNLGYVQALFKGTKIVSAQTSRELVYYGDGIGGFTTVTKYTHRIGEKVGYSLLNSGKVDASVNTRDMYTQTLLAHFPLLYHKNPKNVLVLGLGSGVTAGEVLHYPIQKLDVVEINRQVVTASDFFIRWNNNVLTNPKTELIIQDGRAHLELTNRRYDVIISEPSNPWMAGLATLFTYEFFQLVKERLNDNGVFVQWIHPYDIDWASFAMTGRTFATVFPNSILVRSNPLDFKTDYLLVGFKGDNDLDLNIAKQKLSFAQQSNNISLLNHTIFYNLIVNEDLGHLFGKGHMHSDNWPRLEFSAPKEMYFTDISIEKKIISNIKLNDKTQRIISANLTDVDSQIDFAAYAQYFGNTSPDCNPLRIKVNFPVATFAQKERYAGILEKFCSDYIVTGFADIQDKVLKNKCIGAQINAMHNHIDAVRDKAPSHYHMGKLYSKMDMLDESQEQYSQALILNPDYLKAHMGLGELLERQGKLIEARHHYDTVLKAESGHPNAHYHFGNTFVREGKIETAIAYYTKVLRIYPNLEKVHNRLGVIMLHNKKFDIAIGHFKAALGIKPDYVDAQLNLSSTWASLREIDNAIQTIQTELRRNPNNAELYNRLGKLYEKVGKLDRAAEHYQQAILSQPEYVPALNNLAMIYAHTENSEKAISLFKKITTILPESAVTHYNLACMYSRQNKVDESIEFLRKAIERGYDRWDIIKTDKDLEIIRSASYYKELVEFKPRVRFDLDSD